MFDKELLHLFENANSVDVPTVEVVHTPEPELTEEEERLEKMFRKARMHDFLVFNDCVAFQKRLTKYIEVWILLNDDGQSYSVSRFNFYGGRTQEKVLANTVTFDEAITISANHTHYFNKNKAR